MNATLSIEGMTCAHCVARVTNALSNVAGVRKVKVDLKKNEARIQVDQAADEPLRAAVAAAGYSVTSIKKD